MKYWKEYRSRLKKEVWCVDGWINGERVRDSGWDTKGEAEDAIAALRTNGKRKKYGQTLIRSVVTLGTALEEYEKDLDETIKSHRNRRSKLRAFRDHFGSLTEVTSIDTAAIRTWMLEEKRKRNLKTGTYNLELNFVGSLLNSVARNFTDLKDWRAPVMPRVPEDEGRSRILSEEEAVKIFKALREAALFHEKPDHVRGRHDIADLLEVCLLTGMRVGEVLHLTWDKTSAGIIHISKTKTRKPRDLPIKARLAEILERRRNSATSKWIFPNSTGTGPRGTIYTVLRRAAERAGVDYGQTDTGFTIHDLRHTFASIMLRKGTDLATLADLLGHSKKAMTMRYSHATLASREAAMEGIEDYGDLKKLDGKSPSKKKGKP